MNWGTIKKGEVKKTDKVVELRPGESGFDSSAETQEQQAAEPTQRTEDLDSGMELLELDFLLGIIESTEGEDKNDVMMRKLCFNEVIRRSQQNEMDSFALKVYSINDNNLYGKDIQCHAMKELALRTEHKKQS